MMRELFSDRARPFYSQAPPVVLGPLPPEPLAEYIGIRFEREGRDPQRVLGALLDVTQGHSQRSMMLAAHLFAATAPGEAADEATLEEPLTTALREADGELARALGCAHRLPASRTRRASKWRGALQLGGCAPARH
jgi:hypothetical protein